MKKYLFAFCLWIFLFGLFFKAEVYSDFINRSPDVLELKEQEQRAINFLRSRYQRPLQYSPDLTEKEGSKIHLGKKLFFDPRLSNHNKISCSSCHNPQKGWGDDLPRGVGFSDETLLRRTPSLWNVGWGKRFFWDGRATALEGQVVGPLFSKKEMNAVPFETFMDRLKFKAPEYENLFEKAFRTKQAFTLRNLTLAIAEFEKTIVSDRTVFDEFIEGNDQALTLQQKRGFLLFNSSRTQCSSCHSTWRFTEDAFHDTGILADNRSPDFGRGGFYRDSKWNFHFKVSSLRDVSSRKFFMHDGSFSTLEAVIDFYNRGGDVDRSKERNVASQIRPLGLSEEEKEFLKYFLQTL